MTLCYLQARGGSKRFPDKNLALWNGIPMVADAIEKAKATGIFDTIAVSSDDPRILRIAADYGVLPLWRTPEASSDTATDDDVAREVLRYFPDADIVCKLYPCIPLVKIMDIIWAYQIISLPNREDWWDGIHSAILGANGYDGKDAGAFYFFRADAFKKKDTMALGSHFIWTQRYIDSVDINTYEDLELAKKKAGIC